MSARIEACEWPLDRLGEALLILAERAGVPRTHRERAARLAPSPASVDEWLTRFAAYLGLELEEVESTYADYDILLARAAPALLRVRRGEQVVFLLVARRATRGRVVLCTPDGRDITVSLGDLRAAALTEFERPFLEPITQLLAAAGVPERRRGRSLDTMLRKLVGNLAIDGCFTLRHQGSASFWRDLRAARIGTPLAVVFVAHVFVYALGIAAWVTLGRGALQGVFDQGWFVAWVLLMVTSIPFTLVEGYASGLVALRFGAALKQKLLVGSLQLDSNELRNTGAGEFLGRVIESETVEALLTGTGFTALLAVVDFMSLPVLLSQGAIGPMQGALFVGWVALTLVGAAVLFRLRSQWTDRRVHITRDVVERMVGHRTRLAQEHPDQWHVEEDSLMTGYFQSSRRLDRAGVLVPTLLGRGWLVLGIAMLAFVFVRSGTHSDPAAMAAALGGIMLSDQILQRFAGGLSSLGDVFISGKVVLPLFRAAHKASEPGLPFVAAQEGSGRGVASAAVPLLEVRDAHYTHEGRSAAILDSVSLTVRDGDRILLEGPSGGGKSTLASIVTGLRRPDAGLVLLRGLDVRTVGETAWRQSLTSAPQFHENHVLTEPFSFNLLMGRRWPARPADIAEAVAICGELGLGDLLRRMPAGIHQLVGESGWQLSHGERSRMFIARALLQDADVVILDESLGALDPESYMLALECILRRAKTLVVIAHP